MSINALAVVAHHDDAVLWMGGTIQRMRAEGWNWHIVAMCVPDTERQEYYRRSCEAFTAKSTAIEFADYQGGGTFSKNRREDMIEQLTNAIQNEKYDWVFTHSRDQVGEYGGHANHSEVMEIVLTLVKEGRLGCGTNRLAYFCYHPVYGWGGRATVARPDASHYLQLNYEELSIKCDWCRRVPDPGNLQNLAWPCPNPEAFEGDNLALPSPFIPR